MSYDEDYQALLERIESPVERILNAEGKEIDKAAFTSKELMDGLFREGVERAEELYCALETKAKEAGAIRKFQNAYQNAKKAFLREKFSLDRCKPLEVEGFPENGDSPFCLPENYELDPVKGILEFDYKNGSYLPVFPHPVIVSERFRNIDTGEEKNRVLWSDHGEVKSLICDAATVSNTRSILQLRSQGIRVNSDNASNLVRFLAAFVDINIDRIPILRSTSRLGFLNRSLTEFIPYSNDVIFDGEIAYKAAFEGVRQEGDYAQWKAFIREKALGNDIARVYLAASLASVLVPVMKKLPFIVHVWGVSGCGKTVGLYVANSIWGQPEDLCLTFDATRVAVERYAGMFHNLPLAMNEGESNNPHKMSFQQFGYMFGEGKGRGRGNDRGGVDYIPTWQSVALTNAERSILDGKSKEGFINRVLEFYTSEPLFEDLPGAADFVKENFGFAGKDFVLRLQEWLGDGEKKQWLSQYYDYFLAYCRGKGTDKQAMAMSLVLLADMLFHHFVLGMELPDAQRETTAYGLRISNGMKTQAEIDITARAYEYLCGWVAQNRWYFDTPNRLDDENGSNVVCRECYGRIEEGPDRQEEKVWMITGKFNEVLKQAGFDPSKTIKEFIQRGILTPGNTGKPSISKKINKTNIRCYLFRINDSDNAQSG